MRPEMGSRAYGEACARMRVGPATGRHCFDTNNDLLRAAADTTATATRRGSTTPTANKVRRAPEPAFSPNWLVPLLAGLGTRVREPASHALVDEPITRFAILAFGWVAGFGRADPLPAPPRISEAAQPVHPCVAVAGIDATDRGHTDRSAVGPVRQR
jgi:hypothetical protein